MKVRVGQGFDVHKHVDGPSDRVLILGGVRFPDERPLAGHSDADVIAHAAADALLGAAGLGDIGEHFSDTDPRWKGADSLRLLERAIDVREQRGFMVINVDVPGVCETPKIGPWAEAMCQRLGAVLRIGSDRVSIKGKTNERMGWIGRGEGLAVLCTATLVAR